MFNKKRQQQEQKQQAAEAALDCIESGMVLGLGSGSTVEYLIDCLPQVASRIDGVVASSQDTAQKVKAHNISVYELNDVGDVPLYIDSADEVNDLKQMIKGGGGALTGEKIVASASEKFVCMVDQSKHVKTLGEFPVAIEVIPKARSLVARQIVKLGGSPAYRQGFETDYGNIIIDAYHLDLTDPRDMEQQLTLLPGVVSCGIFAGQAADQVIVAGAKGVDIIS